jgi:hypothetical protein
MSREHRDLLLSLRALASILREPDRNDEETEAILARILEAELNQVSVLDGELLTALRLERGDPGALREMDLARVLRTCARKTGRMMAVETRGAVPLRAHEAIVVQAICSGLALAHRIADGPVRAWAERREGGGSIKITTTTNGEPLPQDERIALLHRIVRAGGGRFVIERNADDGVTLHLTFYTR